MKTAKNPSPLVKISELARLSGVPAPTIKHYMREGLLPKPARRTSRNMAYYDARLADRVRAIKELQQSYFLPLQVIGELLAPPPSAELRDDLDPDSRRRLGQFGPALRAGHLESRQRAASAAAGAMERREILAGRKLSAAELDQLAALGLAEPRVSADGKPRYSDADLEIVEVIHETRARKLEGLFPMEILGPYLDRVRELVQMEIGLFRDRVRDADADLPDQPMADIVRDATHLAERLIVAMRTKLLLAALPELTSVPGESGPGERATRGSSRRAGKQK